MNGSFDIRKKLLCAIVSTQGIIYDTIVLAAYIYTIKPLIMALISWMAFKWDFPDVVPKGRKIHYRNEWCYAIWECIWLHMFVYVVSHKKNTCLKGSILVHVNLCLINVWDLTIEFVTYSTKNVSPLWVIISKINRYTAFPIWYLFKFVIGYSYCPYEYCFFELCCGWYDLYKNIVQCTMHW